MTATKTSLIDRMAEKLTAPVMPEEPARPMHQPGRFEAPPGPARRGRCIVLAVAEPASFLLALGGPCEHAAQDEDRGHHRVGPGVPCSSHAKTPATDEKRHAATVGPGPTLIELPPNWLTIAKPCSSVTSSPMNTGGLPRNGASRMNARIARPLSLPAGANSTTRFPRCTQY